MRGVVLAACLLIPAQAMAEDLRFDPAPTQTCLEAVTDGAQSYDCIGKAASACMAQPMGESTVGMVFCLGEEYELWDAKLNDAYQALRADYAVQDKDRAEGAPAMATELRDMQRAWLAFRDARCGFEVAQWYGGTGSNPSFLGCMMQMTADQTLYLWSVFQGAR